MTAPRLLGQRYELGAVLGRGGMAEVHRGRDVRLGREVAIKVLRSDIARDPSFQARFRREAQAAASLNHPAIVAVYDTGEDSVESGGVPYIVMEYVDGQTLRDVLKDAGRLPSTRAMSITADICAALDFSHRNGIVHRDVKPGNVMINPQGTVKVMDFGIARAVSDSAATMTSTAAVIGTAQYLSPEQARGESVDARSDVYSAGCVLFELVVGTPPFTGDSPVAVAYQHVREDPPRPSSINAEVPAALDAIVLKSMSKNPANRYQSAAEMRTDLLRAVAGQPVEATPVMSDTDRTRMIATAAPSRYRPSPAPRPVYDIESDERDRKRKRNGFIALAVALLLLAGGAVALFLVLNGDEAPPPVTMVDVPALQGLDEAAARAAIEDAGLVVGDVTEAESDAANADLVIEQNPVAEESVEENTRIDFVIGTGPNVVGIPPVIGLSQADATATLEAAGFVVVAREQDALAPLGEVVDSSPAVGSQSPPGSTVTIFVSTGVATLPDVSGLPSAEADAQLRTAGYTNLTIVPQESADVAPDAVIETNPRAGTPAAAGDPIQIIVAVAPPPPPTTTTPAPPTPSTPPTSTSTDFTGRVTGPVSPRTTAASGR